MPAHRATCRPFCNAAAPRCCPAKPGGRCQRQCAAAKASGFTSGGCVRRQASPGCSQLPSRPRPPLPWAAGVHALMLASTAAAATAPAGQPAVESRQEALPQEESGQLEFFLSWLLANGVQGIGTAASKVGLYEGEDGERGLAAVAPIAAGEALLRVPLRLAITDYCPPEGEEGGDGQTGSSTLAAAASEEITWSLRLAARLLALRGQGAACSWHPYLQALPAAVPSPLTSFSWEDVAAIEYQPMRRALDHASWLAASAVRRLGGGAYTPAEWEWALSVVHSRTFGTPGKEGGVAVRLLVPVVDMLNHAGDFVLEPPGPGARRTPQACDNVRWDLQAPTAATQAGDPGAAEGEWGMIVSATRDIQAGEELLLSYGERSNDDFFLHYGFVPPRNPHDDVALFTDTESAIEWWLAEYIPLGVLAPRQLQAAISAAYAAAEQEDSSAAAASSVLEAAPEEEAEAMRAELARIKLSAGGLVDTRLVAAFRTLQAAAAHLAGEGWEAHLRGAVARRCRQLLEGLPTPLTADLEQLAAGEAGSGEAAHGWAAALGAYAPAVAEWEQRHGSLERSAAEATGEGRPAAPLLDAGAGGGQDAALLAQLLQQRPNSAVPSQPEEVDEPEVQPVPSSTLPLVYRTYKKLILWDALLLGSSSV